MDYEPIELQTQLYGLAIKKPVGHEDTAVLENLTHSRMILLQGVMPELRQKGIRNLAVNLSRWRDLSPELLAFLEGAMHYGAGFETRYFGLGSNAEFMEKLRASDRDFADEIYPKITGSIDDAVESFSKE